MGQIRIETKVTVTNDNGTVSTHAWDKTITGLTAIRTSQIALPADQTRTPWDPTVEATEDMTDFDFLLIATDGNVDVEFTCNEADANETLQTRRIVSGLPYMLGADDAFYGATGALGGTLDVIDKLRLDEPASAAKVVTVIMAT